MDSFERFDQYSYLEWQNKVNHKKLNRFNSFLETTIKKFYVLYKKKKNSEITYVEYQAQLVKELEIQIKNKGKKKNSKLSKRNSTIDMILTALNKEKYL